MPAVALREIRRLWKKASFAAINWETQPRELYLNRRPAILLTLQDFPWSLPSSRASFPTSMDSHELALLDQFSLAKGLANIGGSVQSVGVYLVCTGIRLVARGLVCLYEPLADFRQRGTRSLFIVPNPSRLNGPPDPGPFSALETHCRHAENVRAHLAP